MSHQTLELLRRARRGDDSAAAELLPAVYADLRALAGRFMNGRNHTLQPTALVHEAYAKLVGGAARDWESRAHFIAVASRAMRQILADYARRKRTQKRGGDSGRVSLDTGLVADRTSEVDLVELHDALETLGQLNERQCRVVEMRFFGDMTIQEVASVLGTGTTTVEDDWRAARAWLSLRLTSSTDA